MSMINLLPPDTKSMYRYARRNRILLHWVVAVSASLVVAIALVAGGYLYLHQQIHDTQKMIASTNQQLAAQDLASTQKQVTEISSNLKLVVQVLSKEILFSKLLKQLGSVIPSEAVLTDLSITQTTGGIDITAQTTNYNAATQLQVNLADPNNQLFSKADIVSINCTDGGGTGIAGKYPCTATYRALFAQNNPFLFINSGATK